MYFRLSRSSRFRVRINVLNVPPIPPTHLFLVPVVPVHLQQVVSASRPVVNGVSLVSSRCLSPFCCAASCLFAFSPRGVILPAETFDRPRQGQDKTKKRHSSPFPRPREGIWRRGGQTGGTQHAGVRHRVSLCWHPARRSGRRRRRRLSLPCWRRAEERRNRHDEGSGIVMITRALRLRILAIGCTV